MTMILLPNTEWVAPEITVDDHGQQVCFSLNDCFRYHGDDAVGGVVLGFRLLQRAAQLLCAGKPMLRHELRVFTSFPGLGVRDVFELVMRLALTHRLQVDKDFIHPDLPAGVTGSFYFRLDYLGKRLALAPVKGAPSDAFIAAGRASKIHHDDPQIQNHWQQEKIKLANQLLSTQPEAVIRQL